MQSETKKKLTLVVGAGASRELGLPTGAELKSIISSLLDIRFQHVGQMSGDSDICQALRIELSRADPPSRDINPHLRAAWRIRDAMPQAISIDNFLDTHTGDRRIELCGKLAIVRSILDSERRSFIYLDEASGVNKLQYTQADQCWLNPFFKTITENCRCDGLEKRFSEVALIVFNYDRCIEHYLYHGLQNYYGIDGQKAASLLRNLEIYHPYGTVGQLPWQTSEGSISFGSELGPESLLSVSKGIKTFTEGTDPSASEIVRIRNAIASSSRVLFLGFAFHPLNIQLIYPSVSAFNVKGGRLYYATAKGISPSDCKAIQSELAVLGGVDSECVKIRNDLACRDVFSEYTRGLSLL
jgi:hypothetical protein